MDIGVLIGFGALLAAAAALAGVALGRHVWPATRRSDAAALVARIDPTYVRFHNTELDVDAK